MKTHFRLLTAGYVGVLIWLNAYLCREVFLSDHFGAMNSMHGFWMALSRLAGSAWLHPTWWRYAYGGMPYEYTYAPLVPSLIAGVSKVTGWPVSRAFGTVAGFVFCFGPVAMFLMAREVTRRAGWSFIAAVAYNLLTPSMLLAPDEDFAIRHVRDARRMLLTFGWDDVPHELALAFVCLSVLFLIRGLRNGKAGSFVWAAIAIAFALLSNAFGATETLIVLLCFLAVWQSADWRKGGAVALTPLAAYLAICPFLPPSLIAVIGKNSNAFAAPLTWTSWAALAGVACGAAALWFVSRRLPRATRFFLLLAWIFAVIPVLDQRKLRFLPQPERYKVDMDVWIILLGVFVAAEIAQRLPNRIRIAAGLVLLWPAVLQVRFDRHYLKSFVSPIDVHQTIEYQTAEWLHVNLPDARVFAPGSIGQWMNVFTDQQQLGGGSFPTIPTVPIQLPIIGLTYLDTGAEISDWAKLWLTAFGVDAIVVPGRASPEYWKPFHAPEPYGEALPLLWRESDTSIYQVPRRNKALAHVVSEDAIVKDAPKDFFDLSQVRAYVAAIESAEAGSAEVQWTGENHARLRTRVEPGRVISLQITYHPGWNALADGKRATITADGLGQMVVHAECASDCEVALNYDGGWEGKGLRIVSLITILSAALISVRAIRRRGHSQTSTV